MGGRASDSLVSFAPAENRICLALAMLFIPARMNPQPRRPAGIHTMASSRGTSAATNWKPTPTRAKAIPTDRADSACSSRSLLAFEVWRLLSLSPCEPAPSLRLEPTWSVPSQGWASDFSILSSFLGESVSRASVLEPPFLPARPSPSPQSSSRICPLRLCIILCSGSSVWSSAYLSPQIEGLVTFVYASGCQHGAPRATARERRPEERCGSPK